MRVQDGDVGRKSVELGRALWADPSVCELVAVTEEKDLEGGNFLHRFEEIFEEEYEPTNEDILTVRVPTTGKT